MTDSEQKLLIHDLMGRMDYDVVLHFNDGLGEDDQILYGCRKNGKNVQFNDGYFVFEFKPYLRHMTSMTTEERMDFFNLGKSVQPYGEFSAMVTDWLNAHYFDYRGLIEKGLAIEAPDNMYDLN